MPARTLDPEHRNFNPLSTNLSTTQVHHDHLIYNPLTQTTHLLFRPQPYSPHLTLDPSTLIVRTTTARLFPDHPKNLTCRTCIYFGDTSTHNLTADVPSIHTHTIQSRDLYALYNTLVHLFNLFLPIRSASIPVPPGPTPTSANPELLATTLKTTKTLLVLTPSQYAVNAVCYWIGDWRRNGFCNNVQKPIENEALVKGIDEVIGEIERAVGVEVLIWGVRRPEFKVVEKYCRGDRDV